MSAAPMSHFENQRLAEIEAGRARVAELHDAKDFKRLQRDAEVALEEDMERRRQLYEEVSSVGDKAALDRAGAEVADQAQTELEAVLHLGDRVEKVVTNERQTTLERLEGDADTTEATLITVDHVTAQAVNQPTILAHDDGQNTEERPLNTSGFPDEVLSPSLQVPEDRVVPKTRKRAEAVARGKVPPTEEIVRPAFEEYALSEVSKVPDEVMS